MHLRHVLTSLLLAAIGLWTLGGLAPRANSALAVTSGATPILQGGGHGGYGLHSLDGGHGFTLSGSIQGIGQVAGSGRINFDGEGNVSAVFTTSVDGTAFTGTYRGIYSVAADGTGSIVLDLPWLGLQATGDFVIVDRGQGTYFTSTDLGYSVTGSTQQM